MGVIRYDITEEGLRTEQLPLCELSILTGVDSSSYLIVDAQQKPLAIRSFTHQAQEHWWQADDRLQATFQKTKLAWLGARFTLVPARLYDGNQRRIYLSSLTKLAKTDTVLVDAIPELDSFLVYALDGEQLSEWRRIFIGSRFYHVLSPMLHQFAHHSRQQLQPQVYAYIKENLLFIIGLENGVLRFSNAFHCKATKDFLYFILLAYEQCGWSAEQVSLNISGELIQDASIYKLLYRYIKTITFLDKLPAYENNYFSWGKKIEATEKHLFYDLLSLQLYH